MSLRRTVYKCRLLTKKMKITFKKKTEKLDEIHINVI